MARLNIDTGTAGNPATGDTLRTAFGKINDNFLELYTDLAATTSSNGILTSNVTNDDVKIFPNGTGIVEIDRLSLNNTTISSLDTNADITIEANGTGGIVLAGPVTAGEVSTNLIQSRGSNADIKLKTAGTGDFIIDTDGQVGIGTVNAPDTKLHIKSASSIITLQRTADANKPGLDFQNSNGNVRAELRMDGTSGTSNEIFVRTYDGSSTAERFRVQHTGAKVTGILKIGDGSTSDNYAGFGDADDLKIFHNGSHSIIRETGTGSLYLQSDTNVIIGKDSSSETMIKGVADGAVELYHDNVKKLNTSSSGVTVVDELHTEGATPHLTLKRTDNANVPTLRFKGSGGTVGASIGFDGTSGTSNELVFQTHDSSLSERFRVTLSGAKVSGHLEVTGAQVDFTALPTSDPGVAGRLFRSGNDVKISTG